MRGMGNVRNLGGGWELSWRPVDTFNDEVIGVPVIRPCGGDWIELPPEALDGLARWSADMRHEMDVSVRIMNSASARA